MHDILTVPYRVFFISAYYIGLSPFKVIANQNGELFAHTWLPQKIICGLLTILSISPHASHMVWFTTKKMSDWSPPLYFRFFTLISRFFWYLISHINVWFHPEKFVAIVKFVEESKALPKVHVRRNCIRGFVVSLTLMFLLTGMIESSGMLNDFDFSKPNDMIHFSNATVLSITFQVSMFVYGCVAGFYWQLLQLFSILILWLPCREFANIVRADSDSTGTDGLRKVINFRGESKLLSIEDNPQWQLIKEKYSSLKELSKLINAAIGGMMFSYTAFALFTYSYLLDSVFLTTMVTDRWRLIARYMSVTLTYALAADVCRQADNLKIWVNSDVSNISSKYAFRASKLRAHRINILFHEICTKRSVAIRGWRAFTITYSFVAAVSSVIMTYFIICVQFRFETEKRSLPVTSSTTPPSPAAN